MLIYHEPTMLRQRDTKILKLHNTDWEYSLFRHQSLPMKWQECSRKTNMKHSSDFSTISPNNSAVYISLP